MPFPWGRQGNSLPRAHLSNWKAYCFARLDLSNPSHNRHGDAGAMRTSRGEARFHSHVTSFAACDRIIGGARPPANIFFQNSVALDMWKSRTRSPGQTTPPEHTGIDIPSTWFSIWTMLWLNRKFRTACVTLPFSIAKSPSRVMPVRVTLFGSTTLVYQTR